MRLKLKKEVKNKTQQTNNKQIISVQPQSFFFSKPVILILGPSYYVLNFVSSRNEGKCKLFKVFL